MDYIQGIQICFYISKSTWLQSLLHEIALSQIETALSNACNSSEKYSSLMHSHIHCQSLCLLLLNSLGTEARKW